jgi:multidrug efflux system outer membrane protein
MMLKGLLCLTALVLCACAQTSDYQRPPAPVAAQWPGQSPAQQEGTAPVDAAKPTPDATPSATHWRSYFADPRLQTLIASALENNRDLRIAVARVEEARAQFKIVRADRLPTVNLVGSGSVGSTPAELSGTGSTINGQRFDLALNVVSYEFDFWGRIASLSEAARNSYLATEEAKRAFQLSLVADVASSYFVQLQLNELAELARQSVASREMTLRIIGKGRDIGATYDFEYEQAQGALESLRAELEALEHQRMMASNRLNYLVGETLLDLPPGLDLDHQGLSATLAPGLPSEVLLQRPDVMAAERRLQAAHANIKAARAAFLPKIALTAGVGLASQGLATLFNGLAWNFQPAIALPLFDDGRLAAGVEVAQARKVIAVAEYEKTIQLAFREVADLLSAREAIARQLHSAQLNEGSQNRRLEIALARYRGGLANVLEVLDGERALVSAQQNTVQLRRAQLDTAAQLYKALGGGA